MDRIKFHASLLSFVLLSLVVFSLPAIAISPKSRPARAAPSPPSSPAPADAALVARGEYLVRAGDCGACHTAPGGAPFAGGEAINSPFGPIYPPNITPDKTNGIGAWSDDEFYRAMHEGIGKHGEYLYPAFPYQWFTKVSREDVDAIRAYLQTVPPSSAPSKPTRLMFPFNIREGIGAWNDLYFKPGAFVPDASKSGGMEPRRLSRRGARPLRRLPYAQGHRDAAGDIESVFGRRDRRLVRAQHHLGRQARHRTLVRGRSSCKILKTGAEPGKGRRLSDRWRRSFTTVYRI